MHNFIDYKNQRFGSITVVSYDSAKFKWLCRCDCGFETYKRGAELRGTFLETRKGGKRRGIKSCRNCAGKAMVDISGQKFGNWTVLGRNPNPKNDKRGCAIWICECKCGTKKIIPGGYLRSNSENPNLSCRGCSFERMRKTSAPSRFTKPNGIGFKNNKETREFRKRKLDEQNNKCPICLSDISTFNHLDHCHKTGKLRGVLCPQCNKGLGHFKDDPNILIAASEYIQKYLE